MKKEYGIMALILILILIGIWFFFTRNNTEEKIRLESPTQEINTLSEASISPDNIKDYNEIIINNKNNIVNFYIGENIKDLEASYTVSSDKESEVLVSKGSVEVARPYDVVKLWRREIKAGGATLMAVVLKDTRQVTLNAKSSAIAMVLESLENNSLKVQENTINKILAHPKLIELENIIFENLSKSTKISPMDFNSYPEISPLIDIIKNDILK